MQVLQKNKNKLHH